MGAVAALQLHRRQLEVSIVWALSARLLVAAVLYAKDISSPLLACFAFLVFLAGCLDSQLIATRWATRAAESQGLCIGASAIPAVVLALHVVAPTPHTAQLFASSLAAAYGMLALQLGLRLVWSGSIPQQQQQQQQQEEEETITAPSSTSGGVHLKCNQSGGGPTAHPQAAAATPAAPPSVAQPQGAALHYMVQCLTFLVVVLLDCLTRHHKQQQQQQQGEEEGAGQPPGGGLLAGPSLTSAATAAALGPVLLQLQLALLPGCFTFGEALTLAQATTCLALAAWHHLTHPHPQDLSPWALSLTSALRLLLQHVSSKGPSVDRALHTGRLLVRGVWQCAAQLTGSVVGLLRAAWQLGAGPAAAAAAEAAAAAGADTEAGTAAAGAFVLVLLGATLVGAAGLAVGVMAWHRLLGWAKGPQQPAGPLQQQQQQCQRGRPSGEASTGNAGSSRSRMGQPSPPPSQLAAAGALLCLPLVLVLLGLVLLVVARLAAWTLLVFLPAQPQRWQLLAYWVATLAASLPIMRSAAARAGLPQIVLRKGYHLLAALLFIPVFFLDRQLMCVSLAIAFAALVGVEAARCLRVPLLGDWVHTFMVKFVDERDGGVVYVTHFTLLLGLAVPMWLALWVNHVAVTTSTSSTTTSSSSSSWTAHAATGDNSQGCVDSHGLSAPASCWGAVPPAAGAAQLQLLTVLVGLCGMVIIGVGDTMAAYCGKLYGSRAIHIGSRKTLEGTVAGAVSSMATWGLLLTAVGMAKGLSSSGWVQLGVVTAGASLLEACTTQLDNLMIPLWYLPQVLLIAAGK